MNDIYLGDNNFTIEDFEKYLEDILVVPGKAHITFETGEYGMLLIHRLMADITSKLEERGANITILSTEHNGVPIEMQYVEYKANDYTLRIEHNPKLDKVESREDLDPITGFPKKSCTLYFKNIE